MDERDRACIAALWATSTPGARWRVLREERLGAPAYDEDWAAPAARCANPRCRRPMPVAHDRRRYCAYTCRQQAYYWRRRALVEEAS